MKAPLFSLLGLLVFGTGGWLVGTGRIWGVLVLILGLFVFVMAFASSFPQSVEYARDE